MKVHELFESKLKTEEVPKIWKILGKFSIDDLEFVFEDDDGEPVLGPDGEEGWFNSSIPSNAVKNYNPTTVRLVRSCLYVVDDLYSGTSDWIGDKDLKKIMIFIANLIKEIEVK